MLRNLVFILVVLLPWVSKAQYNLSWNELLQTQYRIISEGENVGLFTPNFPKSLQKLEGQEVVLSGYIVPMDIEGNLYALSKNPFTSCFFCGNAGPNTVIELQFPDAQGKFLVDQFLIIKGVLELNNNDPNELFFKIIDAQIHG